MKKSSRLGAVVLGLSALLGGCISHPVKFDNAAYTVNRAEGGGLAKTSVVAVITPETLAQKKTIASWMTGIGNRWDVEPGAMLKDVVEIEFPQTFAHYELDTKATELKADDQRLMIELSLPTYDFADFHASVVVHAIVTGPGQVKILDKLYPAEGFKQGSKMFFAGAFGMKSSIRQSSLDAFKQVFVQLRADIEKNTAAH